MCATALTTVDGAVRIAAAKRSCRTPVSLHQLAQMAMQRRRRHRRHRRRPLCFRKGIMVGKPPKGVKSFNWEHRGRRKSPSREKKEEKYKIGLRKSSQNIGIPYQIEDNKAAPSAPPQWGGASRRPIGVLVVFHLVRISYAFGPFPEPIVVRFSKFVPNLARDPSRI